MLMAALLAQERAAEGSTFNAVKSLAMTCAGTNRFRVGACIGQSDWP